MHFILYKDRPAQSKLIPFTGISHNSDKMLLFLTVSLTVAVTLTAGSVSIPGIVTTENYTHDSILDKDQNYVLFWKYNTTHVTFEVHVKTRGYVGFGISSDGQMSPADVVVGWVAENGTTHFGVSKRGNKLYVSRVIRKPTFCICESSREADHRLCFRYIDSTIPLLSKSEISSI